MKNMIIYWLEQIHAKLSEMGSDVSAKLADLGDDVNASSQSDWSETDSTAASYIQHKPSIPAGAIIVSGTVSDSAFTPSSASFTTTRKHITEGSGLVYLSYSGDTSTVYDLVVTVNATSMVSAGGKTWSASSGS